MDKNNSLHALTREEVYDLVETLLYAMADVADNTPASILNDRDEFAKFSFGGCAVVANFLRRASRGNIEKSVKAYEYLLDILRTVVKAYAMKRASGEDCEFVIPPKRMRELMAVVFPDKWSSKK